jgi:hypothetical protein
VQGWGPFFGPSGRTSKARTIQRRRRALAIRLANKPSRYHISAMAPSDDPYIAALREHTAETRSLLSNRRKPERERMVVRAYLRSGLSSLMTKLLLVPTSRSM